MSIFSKARDHFSAADQEQDETRTFTENSGCAFIDSQPDRTMATIHGTLQSITILPVGSAPALEAELYDGSGSVTLIWLGRRRIVGVSAGRQLRVRGRLGMRNGKRVIYNPHYELDA